MINASDMLSKAKRLVLVVCLGMATHSLHAMVFDNRYIPLLQKPFITIEGRPSHLNGNLFAMTGSKAINDKEKTVGIPEIGGEFDLGQLVFALIKLGKPLPIRTDLVGQPIPMRVDGTIQTQGFEFSYFQSICDIAAVGFDWFVMHLNSTQEFRPPRGQLNFINGIPNAYIDEVRREIFQEIGLNQADSSEIGMGDLDLYIKLWHYWDYILKMRHIEAGFRFGVLVPAGVTRQINSPASIPFGGNGHWGLYAQLDAEFEVREDIKVGVMTRLSKRLRKTSCQRLPVAGDGGSNPGSTGQPQIFGATVGTVNINPGINFVFSPYFTLENLIAGFGMRVFYTYTKHACDQWSDPVPLPLADGTLPPIDLTLTNRYSAWKTDYVSISAFYDFGKTKVRRSLDPILIFNWDVPSLLLGSDLAVNTHKVSLGLEVNF